MAGQLGRRSRGYDEYMKAYSVAMLPGNERANVSYGGKSKLLILVSQAAAEIST